MNRELLIEQPALNCFNYINHKLCWYYIQWTRGHLHVRNYIKNFSEGNQDEVAQGVPFWEILISEHHTRHNTDPYKLHFLCEVGFLFINCVTGNIYIFIAYFSYRSCLDVTSRRESKTKFNT